MWINPEPDRISLFFSYNFFDRISNWTRLSLYPAILLLVWGFICTSILTIAAGGLLLASGLIFIAILEVEKAELRIKIRQWQEEN